MKNNFNPPFSLFREYVKQLMDYGKKFIIIGNMNVFVCKEIFPYFQKDELWFGTSHVKEFKTPCGEIQKFGNICWYTNIQHKKRNTPIDLYKRYSNEYPKYDNYDAIEVSKVSDIPMDYNGIMGVPISFIDKYCPKQFEILWQASGKTRKCCPKNILDIMEYKNNSLDRGGCCVLNGKRLFTRIMIRRKSFCE